MNETVGKKYTDTRSKQQDDITIFEAVHYMGKDIMTQLGEMVERDKRKTDKDFFVEVCIYMNPLMPDVPEWRMISRHTCPTPFQDRSVFHYHKKEDRLEFLWHVPSNRECEYYIKNKVWLSPDEYAALKYVIDFVDGTLLRKAKLLNGETNDYELTFFKKGDDGQPITS